jgi:hypothetical protein
MRTPLIPQFLGQKLSSTELLPPLVEQGADRLRESPGMTGDDDYSQRTLAIPTNAASVARQ